MLASACGSSRAGVGRVLRVRAGSIDRRRARGTASVYRKKGGAPSITGAKATWRSVNPFRHRTQQAHPHTFSNLSAAFNRPLSSLVFVGIPTGGGAAAGEACRAAAARGAWATALRLRRARRDAAGARCGGAAAALRGRVRGVRPVGRRARWRRRCGGGRSGRAGPDWSCCVWRRLCVSGACPVRVVRR